MWPIGILLMLQAQTGSYAAAGIVAALMTAGRAAGTPVVSRLVDRWGLRRVVGWAAVGSSLSGLGLAVLGSLSLDAALQVSGCGALALLGGMLTPPIQPVVRTLLPGLVAPEQLSRAFSLDASVQEVIFIGGPLAAFGIAASVGPGWAVFAGAVLQVVGAFWLLVVSQDAATAVAPSVADAGSRLPFLTQAVVVGGLVGLLLVAANSAVEAAVAAEFGDRGLVGGVLLALYSAASLGGGLLLARWTSGVWAQTRWLGVVGVGLLLASLNLHPAWLGAALVIAGLGVAPVFASVAGMVSASTPAQRATEAFGWVDSAAVIGASLGFAVAGVVVGELGPAAALGLGAALALGGSLLAAGAAARRPRRLSESG